MLGSRRRFDVLEKCWRHFGILFFGGAKHGRPASFDEVIYFFIGVHLLFFEIFVIFYRHIVYLFLGCRKVPRVSGVAPRLSEHVSG